MCLCKISEDRHRYCNLVASLKPVIDEEMGMLSELASIEDVMQKLGRVTTNPDLLPDNAMEQVIDDAAASYEITGSGSSLSLATPTSSAMGSRQSSMSSIASISSASVSQQQNGSIIRPHTTSENDPMSPSRSSVTSVDSLSRHRSFNQYDFASLRRGGGQKNGFSSTASYNGGDSYMASERPNSALSSLVRWCWWSLGVQVRNMKMDFNTGSTCPLPSGRAMNSEH